jgi:hypothetical protein
MAHQFDAPLSPARTIIANRILAHLASQPEPPVNERTLGGIFDLFTHEIEQYLLRTPHGRREVTIQVEQVLHYLYHGSHTCPCPSYQHPRVPSLPSRSTDSLAYSTCHLSSLRLINTRTRYRGACSERGYLRPRLPPHPPHPNNRSGRRSTRQFRLFPHLDLHPLWCILAPTR